MKNINVTLRVDNELKKEADALFADLGLSLTTAFNIFLRQSVREQRIPFKISRNKFNSETVEAMKDAETGNNLYGPFDTIEELMEELNA